MVRTGNKGTEIPLSLVVATYNGGPCRLCLSKRSCILLSYCAMQGCGRRQNEKVMGPFEMAPPSQFVISFARFYQCQRVPGLSGDERSPRHLLTLSAL